MSRQTRETLLGYFDEGQVPTKDHFADLIDSTLNLRDEGFEKTDRHGLKVRSQISEDALVSFYRGFGSDDLLWQTALASGEPETGDAPGTQRWRLVFKAPVQDAKPVLTLDPGGRVGVNQPAPRCALDVAGTVASRGRTGAPPQLAPEKLRELVADGEWHDITPELQGCHAYEVMAGVGLRNSGHWALLHAVAMNTNHPAWFENWFGTKRRIHAQHAHYKRRADRLRLRWHSHRGENGHESRYVLQIRTDVDYLPERKKDTPWERDVKILVTLTKLWEDERMLAGQPQDGGAAP